MLGKEEVQVFPDGSGFIAIRADQPSLSAYGATRETAVKELQVVLELAREIAEEDGATTVNAGN